MLERYLFLFLLFIGAAITVHLVSWVGSVLHSVPNGMGSSYAVFTFRADQNKSMSTNIFMNILIPNVCFIFIYMILYTTGVKCQYDDLIFYVIFYYVYRMLLICFILKRGELLNVWYELFSGIVGSLIAYFLANYFLVKPQEVFIEVQELVNEFWLLVILIAYRFIVLLLDKLFCQKNVVSQNMLDKYIRNKFQYFYHKYKSVVNITREEKILWILLFSIMIFENYNRGGIKRKLERIKIFFGRSATVGIMQVRSTENLSDEESIVKAYEKLKNEIMAENLAAGMDWDDEMQIEYYAYRYNPSEDYSKSVSYIYQRLRTYLEGHPEFCKVFHLKESAEESQEAGFLKAESHKAESPKAQSFLVLPELQMQTKEDALPTCDDTVVTSQSSNPYDYWTFDDVVQMSGLTPKEVKKRIKKKNMIVLLLDSEVQEHFKKYMPKG